MADDDEVRLDFPFDEVVAGALVKISQGWTIHQKFTCEGCDARLTMGEENQFFEQGTCDQCDAITDIRKRGCNYVAIKKG